MQVGASDWWKTYFRGAATEFTRRVRAPQALGDATRIERALALAPGSKVLDVPCGHGRIAIELAARGHHVTGMDLAGGELALARRLAAERGVEIDLRVGDMRVDLPEAAFDATVCLGHSFGYFNDEEDAAFLRAARASLRPGGSFALETGFCAESYLPRIAELSRPQWAKAGDIVLLQRESYDPATARVNIEQTFLVPGTPDTETKRLSCRLYTCRELVAQMRAAGFEDVRALRGTGEGPFEVGGPLLLVGRSAA